MLDFKAEMIKLNAAQLRKGKGSLLRQGYDGQARVEGEVKKQDIYIILDNVLDTNKVYLT